MTRLHSRSTKLACCSIRARSSALLIVLLAIGAFAEDFRQYASALIAPGLSEDADAVIRLYETSFVVENPKAAGEKVRRITTILNQHGRDYGRIHIYYDRFRSIKSLNGILIDANGQKIRDLKKADIEDYSAISGFSLYDDHRVRVAEFYHDSYPYTVIFEYEIINNGLIGWPTWYPQWRGAPVERTFFEISAPPNLEVRYYPHGLSAEPTITQSGKRKTFRWESSNLPLLKREPYGPTWSVQAPSLLTAPVAFEIAGSIGDMSSWESFGRWYHGLSKNRATLPEAALLQVKAICDTVTGTRDKVRMLYQHLQRTTRYVSVQLGIGGWQPFEASYVFERGYGDCKALTNYMLALLQAAGITSYPALVRNGSTEPDVIAEFPSNQFNHAILFVPLDQDTLWLECTSQTVPFGHLGKGNEDRNVLVVTPEGGKLVRTPFSQSDKNQQIRHAEIVLKESGDATAEIRTTFTGNQQDRVRYALAQQTPREREHWLRRDLQVASFKLIGADFSSIDQPGVEVTLSCQLELPGLAARTGTRLFLQPNSMERWTTKPPEISDRTQPVDLAYAFLDSDSITYVLPPRYAIEHAPQAVALETPFGRYHAETVVSENRLEYARYLEVRVNKLPASEYDAYREFVAQVVKADDAKVVLVRKN